MKILKIFILGLFLSNTSYASLFSNDSSRDAKAFSFKFSKFQGEVYEYEVKADSKDDAFKKAADACFNHFKQGRRISMDYGQDIIDICVNPRTI